MAVVPDTRSSIVIAKSFPYRGTTRIFTNRYHFEGAVPADSGEWATFGDAIVASEKGIYDSAVTIVQATGYDSASATPTNPHGDAVWSKLYAEAGTFVPAEGDELCPGDCVGMLRYATLARSSKNHPVYLFNYYHRAYRAGGSADDIATDWESTIADQGADWIAGFSDGSTTHQRCGPHGAVAISYSVDEHIRHRDLPN